MADIIDNATDNAELFLGLSLQNRPRTAGLAPKGSCHYCDEPFTPEDAAKKLFCDIECSEGYEYEKRLKALR